MVTRFILAAVLAAATITPAVAQDYETRQVSVRTDDLNLGSAAGRKTLEHRISGAVEQVCSRPGVVSMWESGDVSRCRAKAMAGAHRDAERIASNGTVVIASK